MTPPIGFDPGADLDTFSTSGVTSELVEAHLEIGVQGRLYLRVQHDDGRTVSLLGLRPDFLDEFVAQARAREENAA